MADYDVIVIGAGPGGYVCAIRCAQLGLKTACVEGRETLGGTCLNIGCIPSKALLHASELYHEAHATSRRWASWAPHPTIDVAKLQGYKQATVDRNTKGIEFLFKKNKVDWLKGWGKITAPGEVSVDDAAHKAKSIVIASGSEVTPLKGVTIDEKAIVSSTGALDPRRDPEAPRRDRRRRHRPRARLGLCPARQRGDRARVPRPDHPRAWTSRSARRCRSCSPSKASSSSSAPPSSPPSPARTASRVT